MNQPKNLKSSYSSSLFFYFAFVKQNLTENCRNQMDDTKYCLKCQIFNQIIGIMILY